MDIIEHYKKIPSWVAKRVVKKYKDVDHYVNEKYYFYSLAEEYTDNSVECARYYNRCEKIVSSGFTFKQLKLDIGYILYEIYMFCYYKIRRLFKEKIQNKELPF